MLVSDSSIIKGRVIVITFLANVGTLRISLLLFLVGKFNRI